RHGRIYPTRSHWTRAHRRWFAEQRFEHAAQQILFEELIRAVEEAGARRDRLEEQMVALLPSWSLRGVVEALQALRVVGLLSAITLMAEIGDFRRFANRANSWPSSAWCCTSIPPVPPPCVARSPRRATTAPGGSWWKAPGPTGCPSASVSRF